MAKGPVLIDLETDEPVADVAQAPPVPDLTQPQGQAMQSVARIAARKPSALAKWFLGIGSGGFGCSDRSYGLGFRDLFNEPGARFGMDRHWVDCGVVGCCLADRDTGVGGNWSIVSGGWNAPFRRYRLGRSGSETSPRSHKVG